MGKHDLPDIRKISEVASALGLPNDSLKKISDKNGFTIQIGRTAFIKAEEVGELLETCRVKEKAPASTGAREKTESRSGKSEMARPALRPAQAAATMLKNSSRNTSKGSTAQLVQLPRKT